MKFVEFIKKPKTIIIFSVVLALLMALIPILITVFSGEEESGDVNFVTMEAGAALTFKIDEDGEVLAIYSSNEDGDVLLCVDVLQNTEGIQLSSLAERFVDAVAMLGYLDMEAGALKISLPTSNSDSSIGEKLEADVIRYLKSRGIYAAVVTETLSAASYKTKNGFEGERSSIDKLFSEATPYFSNRGIENLTAKKLAERYENSALSSLAASLAKRELDGMLDKVQLQIEDIRDILDLADDIEEHGENPALSQLDESRKDYFTVVESYTDFTDEFGVLISQMQTLLSDYERIYGSSIDSKSTLLSLFQKSTSIDKIRGYVDSPAYRSYIDECLRFFEYFGHDTSDVRLLFGTPTTKEEYNRITAVVSMNNCERLFDMYKDLYEEERDAVSDDEYSEFIDGILEEYESLSDYFNDIY